MNESNPLKNWNFKIDEISANAYRVRGVDKWGRSVEKKGTNPEILLGECKRDSLRMSEIR